MSDLPAAPSSIGPYLLENLLGRGGMGEVWAARDTRLDRRVAIKHVKAGHDAEGVLRARFRREAWAAARIAHPSVVPVFDVVEDESGEWIVMELVDGPTLAELVEDEPLGLVETLRYGRHVAAGLAAAHGEGLVHRDLKTENVMIAPSGHAKILDFGLAKRLDQGTEEVSLTEGGVVLGTVRCMSPEQARGLEVDARSDLFALGTLLYEVVTGRSPFVGETSLDTMSRVVAHEPPPVHELRPGVPAELSQLISNLLEKSPERRPQTAAEVAQTLERMRDSETWPEAVSVDLPGQAWAGDTLHQNTRADRVATQTTAESATAESTPTAQIQKRPFSSATLFAAVIAFTLLIVGGWFFLRDHATQTSSASVSELRRQAGELIEDFEGEENIERAIELLRQATSQNPESAAAWADLSTAYWRAYWNRGRDTQWREQSLAAALRAVELNKFLASAHVARGNALTAHGEFEQALESFARALKLQPANAGAFRGRGDVAREQGDWATAKEAYQASLEVHSSAEVIDELGVVYFQTGDFDLAEETFLRSIALVPARTYPHSNLAAVYHMQGRLREATDQVQKALSIRPTEFLNANLGTLLFFQGLYVESAEAFESALAMGAANWHIIWANLGDAYRYIPGAKEKALEAYRRALQIIAEEIENQGRDPALLSRQALYFAKAGQRDQAIEVLAGSPAATDAYSAFRVAVSYEFLGHRRQAITSLGKALELGYPQEDLARDPDLAKLRQDPAYHRLLASRD